ncbi:hypothetical protein [Haloarchaeobius iranensis]|uniref:Uncharacterized protein n=1 Tax=Haloarchaeobius iranensis TaxID=996166 RepID=A0A1G9UI62_9EURY|nr:hypothetical protein [Haloarchaeobius iranensis]SDM59611.1 hypothetical protein SAMN05192554_104143 [Haloarchaeobius iranensis]
MYRAAIAACLVLSLVLAGCSGLVEPVEPRPSGHVQGSVVSEDSTVVSLTSSSIPEDSHVAAAVRAAVAEHERVSGGGTVAVFLNASELATAEGRLEALETSSVRYEGYVVELLLAVED